MDKAAITLSFMKLSPRFVIPKKLIQKWYVVTEDPLAKVVGADRVSGKIWLIVCIKDMHDTPHDFYIPSKHSCVPPSIRELADQLCAHH